MRKVIFIFLVALVVVAGISGFLFVETLFLSFLSSVVLVANYYHTEPGGYLTNILRGEKAEKNLRRYLEKKREHYNCIITFNRSSLELLDIKLDNLYSTVSLTAFEYLDFLALKEKIDQRLKEKRKLN